MGEYFDRMHPYFDRMDNHIEEMKEEMNNKTNQRLDGMQLHVQHPRHATKAYVMKYKETRARKEDADTDEKLGDILFTERGR